jgi:N6-adenosine-specific RNA methylase IME4
MGRLFFLPENIMLDQFPARFEDGPFTGLPRGYFRIALADPGWRFRTWSPRGRGKCADRHYRCEELEQIMSLPVAELMADDAVLFLWVVQTHFVAAMEVLAAWGFEYKTVGFTWVKMPKTWSADQLPLRIRPRMGCGFYTRANSEQCWIARRGKGCTRVDRGIDQVVFAPVREHSRKPSEVHTRIERLFGDVAYIELYAREQRPGWGAWGDQVQLNLFGGRR